jgi:methylenetetrahydrofolate reductase (NADPH)
MVRIIDLWKAASRPTLSFEVFPARTEKAAIQLGDTLDELVGLTPDFMSVTFGAGGSTREGSGQLVHTLMQKGMDVVAYFACYGLSPAQITEVLDHYRDLGVETILAVRGDIPREGEFTPHPESLLHASELVSFVKSRYAFCLGVAGYPEGHIEAVSLEDDLGYLKVKVDQGAEFIITNYFYDNVFFFDFVSRCRTAGIEVPILPGVMPIFSVKMLEMLAGLCGATITDEVRQGVEAIDQDDRDALVQFGIDFAVQQCTELIRGGVPGIHIYTMDRSQSAAGIVERLRAGNLI